MLEQDHFSTYPSAQKEKVLEALANQKPEGISVQPLFSQEVLHISRNNTNPDFLELLSGIALVDCLYLLKSSIVLGHFLLAEDDKHQNTTPFQAEKMRRFSRFITFLERLIDDPDKHESINSFLSNGRKYFGMADLRGIVHLSDIMQYASSKEWVDQGRLALVQYPGSFDPFPHRGHINAARIVKETYGGLTEGQTRIVVSTTASNPDKQALSKTFPRRLDNLHRAFINDGEASVLGIVGDFNDKEHRAQQVLLISSFDRDKRFRFMTGSDGFISRVEQALGGDSYSGFLLDENHVIIVSPRTVNDIPSTATAISLARDNFGAEIILAPATIDLISGTMIRSLPVRARRRFATNKFVRLSV